MTLDPISSTPKMLSVWAFHTDIALRLRVELTTTLPDASPEYTLSLSRDTPRVDTEAECERKRWVGAGGGGGRDMGAFPVTS